MTIETSKLIVSEKFYNQVKGDVIGALHFRLLQLEGVKYTNALDIACEVIGNATINQLLSMKQTLDQSADQTQYQLTGYEPSTGTIYTNFASLLVAILPDGSQHS